MRRLQMAIAMLIAFTVAYVATPRTSESLQAQQNVPCLCSYVSGTTGSSHIQCLGTANWGTISCSVIGNQCFIGGYATWLPDSANCLYSGSTMGAISAIGKGSGGPSYFDPSLWQTGIAWGVLSTDCSGNAFGASMDVVHDTWTGSCSCIAGTPTVTSVAVTIWKCGV